MQKETHPNNWAISPSKKPHEKITSLPIVCTKVDPYDCQRNNLLFVYDLFSTNLKTLTRHSSISQIQWHVNYFYYSHDPLATHPNQIPTIAYHLIALLRSYHPWSEILTLLFLVNHLWEDDHCCYSLYQITTHMSRTSWILMHMDASPHMCLKFTR